MPIALGIAVVYLGIGFYRTQRKTVSAVLKRKGKETNEPLWHAPLWPLGFFVAGK